MIQVYTAPLTGNGHDDAYALLAQAHSDFTGRATPSIWKTDRGKPFFVDGSLEFSLSHSRTLAVCALSDGGAVGVDAEDIRILRSGLEARVLTPAERAWLLTQPDRDKAFLTVWTCKEALVKRTGQGLDGQPQMVETMPDEPPDFCFHTVYQGAVVMTVCTGVGEVVRWL